ncbi:hypothetical protein IV417_04715 [Alphaproteobacteria bacterium KMM 3653]|uniref:Uncharacterized protein n=1 Tax=Harenicola maris TaxID=2841044 RepID=A0AAP2CLL4_9RHOB|nr:hypothetical protein [Harenicola maris]
MTWLTTLTGLSRETPQSIRQGIIPEGETLLCPNGRRLHPGTLTLPSLAELRETPLPKHGSLTLRESIADVQSLHLDPANAGASFQAASQFNLLEMIGPEVTPADGIGRYENDHTQGPACAIACGAGTLWRNYFAPHGPHTGQCDAQIDTLKDLAEAIGNSALKIWEMRNGYALPHPGGLARLNAHLSQKSPEDLDILRGLLRLGLQQDTEVTLKGAGHRVTQIYASAMPVAYANDSAKLWEPIAKLVLEAAYEATLRIAAANAARTGNNRLFLTLLGGGAFGNAREWIIGAVTRALGIARDTGLDVRIVSHRAPSPTVAEILRNYS